MKLLTAPEVARRMDVTPRRVYQLVREGLLPAVHLGRHVRVAEDRLEVWLSSGGAQFENGWRKSAG